MVVIGTLLAAYGAVELIWCGMRRFRHPSVGGYWVIPLRGDRADAEWLVRYARTVGRGEVCPIVIDEALTPPCAEETRKICERMQVEFWSRDRWEEMRQTALQDRKSAL